MNDEPNFSLALKWGVLTTLVGFVLFALGRTL